MNFFKNFNIFTLLMTVFVFAAVLRLVDLASFPARISVAESAPPGQHFEQVPGQMPLPAPQDGPETAAAPETKTPPATGGLPLPAVSPYGERSYSAAELEVLQSLSLRRDELDKREKKMGEQEALLRAAEGEVDRKVAELNKIRSELEDLLNRQQNIQDERISSLVKIYENMKPQLAARIFDTLEMEVMLSVISKMSERKSSPILANMDPEKARQVTIQLAEQRKLPGLPASAGKDKTPAAMMNP
ncbi:MAG: flagellar protein FlbB [Pseudomonadota bacterium]